MSNKKSSLIFESGVGTVTGSNFLLQVSNGKNILVDCGLIQGEEFADEANERDFAFDPASIDVLIVTHAHLDHVGRIPKLVKQGFHGPIYSTEQTRDLARLVLEDAARLFAHSGMTERQLYDSTDVTNVFPLWRTIEYHVETEIADGVYIYLKDAGHILGSSMVQITLKNENKKILFTGDLGNSPSPLLRDTEDVGDVDYIVMESTYGDRNHEPKETRISKLEMIVSDTINKGGALVIPTFSIDRTQVLLYELNNMVETGCIKSVPVFLDSPMATSATEIYRANEAFFNDIVKEQIRRGDDIFSFPKLHFTVTSWESSDIDKQSGPKIILAGSGMSVGGRVVSHEAHLLPDPKNTILLVGYQSVGSLGRALADGVKKVHIAKETIHVKARIETLYGFSAHKDSDGLVQFVSTATDRLKEIFVAMGEPKASMHLAQRLNSEYKIKAIMPEIGMPYRLA